MTTNNGRDTKLRGRRPGRRAERFDSVFVEGLMNRKLSELITVRDSSDSFSQSHGSEGFFFVTDIFVLLAFAIEHCPTGVNLKNISC